jgi:hypothetical protein
MKLAAALLALVLGAGAGVLIAGAFGEDDLPEVVTRSDDAAEPAGDPLRQRRAARMSGVVGLVAQ